ncbi:hypothetical protein ABS71_11690 [bacterium SCN 62-11]|nr:MAG: hypothetical protein ABS71_11690 [bacterium SCN 62-11]
MLAPLSFALLLALSLAAKLDGARLPARLHWDGQHWLVQSAGVPLQAGDRILSLEGRPAVFPSLLGDPVQLRSRAELLHWVEHKTFLYQQMKSGTLHLEVLRTGRPLSLEVTPARDSVLSWGRDVWIELLPACFFLWAGWTTLARAPRRPESFWFCWMCLLTSWCYLASTPFRDGAVLHPGLLKLELGVNFLAFLFGPAVLLHVTLLVPEKSVPDPFMTVLYALVGLALLSLDVPLLVGLVGTLYAVVLLAVIRATWRYRSSVHRQQMKWIWAGYVLGLAPGLVFNGLPLLLGRPRIFEDAAVGFFLVCIPWCYSLAIQRYRLFDIETLAEGSLVYLFTLALICVLEMSLLAALGGGFALPASTVILMVVIASAYGGVHTRVAALFRREETPVVQQFQERASGRGSQEVLDCLYATLLQWPAPASLEWCAGKLEVGCRLELGEPVTLEMQLEAGRGLRLGPLPSGRHYSSRVLTLLERLARQAALLYQNARLFEQEVQRRENALAAREGLLNDLHDGVGASLASIRMLSRQPEVSALAGDALFELQHFLYDGLDYTLPARVWVAELRAYGNRTVAEFALEATLSDEVIARSLGLRVFRWFRERLRSADSPARAELTLKNGSVSLRMVTGADDAVTTELFGAVEVLVGGA